MDAHTEHRDLFPEITPFEHGEIALDGPHKMYWEQSGNPEGAPVLFLHGGPGAGAMAAHRCFFDPAHYRVVIFDQRGAGRSRPLAEIADNTTGHLIADIETLRIRLGVERWLIFGGSWGATLALAYGIRHPERCTGFVLRGVFLGRASEIDWFMGGMRTVYPEAWRAFAEFLPEIERGDLLGAYYARLTDPDPTVHGPAAVAWSRYESACSKLVPGHDAPGNHGPGNHGSGNHGSGNHGSGSALGLARLEAHYIKNRVFMPENYLLENIRRLHSLPAIVVQGRYDMVCPMVTADELCRAWPKAELVVVQDAGHSAMEPGIRSALVAATETFKTPR